MTDRKWQESQFLINTDAFNKRKRMLQNTLLVRSLDVKTIKASDAVSKRHQQLYRGHHIARVCCVRSVRHISFRCVPTAITCVSNIYYIIGNDHRTLSYVIRREE